MTEPSAAYTLRENLPPTKGVLELGTYRVPNTNDTLARFKFDELERDTLFVAYGKKTVLDAMALYFGSEVNAHRAKAQEMSSVEETYTAIKSGLVATMESIRTRKRPATETTMLSDEDILYVMQEKYEGRKVALRVRNSDQEFQKEVLEYLVNTFITGTRTH